MGPSFHPMEGHGGSTAIRKQEDNPLEQPLGIV